MADQIELQYPLGSYSVSNPPSNNTLIGDLSTIQSTVNTLGDEVAAKANTTDLTTHVSDTSAHGVTSAMVGTTDTQVITNKDIALKAPEGFLLNGKIVPSVTNNDLTLAIKGLNDQDPSATNPVYCRIGGVIRTITAALSVTRNDGTNWCNAGSSELANQEVDYFAYLGFNATDGVVIGFSRIPYALQYSDFSTTSTNEKYCAISTITNANANDYYHVVGRFSATLSAAAGHLWSVPTYTAKNLVQRPIFETRSLLFVPQITGFSAASIQVGRYKVIGSSFYIEDIDITGTSNATGLTFTIPFTTVGSGRWIPGRVTDNGATKTAPGMVQTLSASATMTAYTDWSGGGWTGSGSKVCQIAQVLCSLT